MGIVTLGGGAQLAQLALLPQLSALQRSVFAVQALGDAIAGVFVGICGLAGWITFVQHDSPFDDFAVMVIFPRAAQAIFGLLIAASAIICLLTYPALFGIAARIVKIGEGHNLTR